MSTISFGDKKSKATDGAQSEPSSVENGDLKRETAQPETTGSEVATRPDATVGSVLPPTSGFTGAWDRKDVRLPRLNLVHKTSANELIEKFGIGSFCFNKEVKLSDGKTPIIITALRAAKDYIQKLPYGDPATPEVFETPEEVEKHGGSLNYADVKSGRYFGPRAHIQIITTLPEGASEEDAALFPYEFKGIAYGMAMFTVASSAYTSVGKELATLCTNNKIGRKGMQFMRLELTSEIKKNSANSWHVPVVKYAGENPAELVDFYASLL